MIKILRIKPSGILVFISFLLLWSACIHQDNSADDRLIIFHAGSLSVPLKEIIEAFNRENPGVKVLSEAAGSRDCARKITDLKKECDILASADYMVIDQMLIPDYANWNIKFASNEMVIAFQDKPGEKLKINSSNWMEVLLAEDVRYGRSEPNADPCGYRTVLVAKLAEKYYDSPGFADELLKKDQKYIRPKETDLLALIETNTIDYFFIYRSVAEQHGLNYIQLPDEINLKSAEYANQYASVSVELTGKEPGSFVTQKGEPMVYGITVPLNAPHKNAALKFVEFLLSDKGMKIMEKNGQPSVIPSYSETYQNIPEVLKKYASNQE